MNIITRASTIAFQFLEGHEPNNRFIRLMPLKKELSHQDIARNHLVAVARFTQGFLSRDSVILIVMERQNDNFKRRKAPKNKADLDPRLVELVKFLARAAAERDYERLHKDGMTPPAQGDEL